MRRSDSSQNLSTEELFRRFAPFVARFLYRMGVEADRLDDVVQDVFVIVHRRGGYTAGPAKPTSYLATIASNAASAHYRRRRVEQARATDTDLDAVVSTDHTPAQILESNESLRSLQLALERLEPELRSTLILADIEGEPCTSIAASTGVPTGTVYWRLHEARKRFRKALQAQPVPGSLDVPIDTRQTRADARRALPLLAVGPFWWFGDACRMLREVNDIAPVTYAVERGLVTHCEVTRSQALTTTPAVATIPAATRTLTTTSLTLGTAGVVAVGGLIVFGVRDAATQPVHNTATASAHEEARASTVGATQDAVPLKSGPMVDERQSEARPSEARKGTIRETVLLEAALPETVPLASPPSPVERSEPGHLTAASTSSAPHPASSLALADSRGSSVNEVTRQPERSHSTRQQSLDALEEAGQIARAERALTSNPAHALALARDARTKFTPSYLPQERDYVEVMALHALGRAREAHGAAARFLRRYEAGPYASRVSKVLGR